MPSQSPRTYSTRCRPAALASLAVWAMEARSAAPAAQDALTEVSGESAVLIGLEWSQLALGSLALGSAQVRSTYRPNLPETIVYLEGKDFEFDYATGQLRRLNGSRIADFRDNVLFGKVKFNHREFPGYGNQRHLVYVDYRSRNNWPWPPAPRATDRLPQLRSRLKQNEPIRLAAFGDSITAGTDVSDPSLIYWNRWLQALGRRHPGARLTGINASTNGDTVLHGLTRLTEKVTAARPNLVLIAFGMNDQNVGATPAARFEQGLLEAMDRVRTEAEAEVILVTPCFPNPQWRHTSGRMPELVEIIRGVAERRHVACADTTALWKHLLERKKPEDLLVENINHPTDFGQWVYFQAMERLGC